MGTIICTSAIDDTHIQAIGNACLRITYATACP